MRVLVTGHNGYVEGWCSCPCFSQIGPDVVGLDTNLYQAATFGDEDAVAAVPAINKDVRDVTHADIDGLTLSPASGGLCRMIPGDLNLNRLHGSTTRRLFAWPRSAAKWASRYIFSSPCSNYGAWRR